MTIKNKIIKCIDEVGFYATKILKVLPEYNTENEYLIVFEGIDNRVRKCIIIGNEASNSFNYKYSIE